MNVEDAKLIDIGYRSDRWRITVKLASGEYVSTYKGNTSIPMTKNNIGPRLYEKIQSLGPLKENETTPKGLLNADVSITYQNGQLYYIELDKLWRG